MAMYRLEGSPASDNANQFTDVPSGSAYERAVVWANEHGIVGGYGNGTFGPDDQVTREQFAAIMRRYAGYKGKDTAARAQLGIFTDYDQISDWAVGYMSWAVAVGVIHGTSTTTLSPQGTTTRSQTAAIIHRYGENTLGVAPAADAPAFVFVGSDTAQTDPPAPQFSIEIPYTNSELVALYGGREEEWEVLRQCAAEGLAEVISAADEYGFSVETQPKYLDTLRCVIYDDGVGRYNCGSSGVYRKGAATIDFVISTAYTVGYGAPPSNIAMWDIYYDGAHIESQVYGLRSISDLAALFRRYRDS